MVDVWEGACFNRVTGQSRYLSRGSELQYPQFLGPPAYCHHVGVCGGPKIQILHGGQLDDGNFHVFVHVPTLAKIIVTNADARSVCSS